MDMTMLNFIPFWIQIRGIPFQYMNRPVILQIARAMGQYIQMDYNEEAGTRLDVVRVRLNWDINHPLKFQRNFQFTQGVNTLLKFHYERLRGFCEICGNLTHDSGRCLIQNGGPEEDPDEGDDGMDDENLQESNHIPNQGVVIEEIEEEEEEHQHERAPQHFAQQADAVIPDDEHNQATSSDSEEKRDHDDSSMDILHNSLLSKRKGWMTESSETNQGLTVRERGDSSDVQSGKRMRESSSPITNEFTEENKDEVATRNILRGAVGPKPPLQP